MNIFKKQPKIGLALSGGGPRGFAHLGVIKVLEDNHIPIDYIAGTSAGSIVGAFYSAKKNIKAIEEYFIQKNFLQIMNLFVDLNLSQSLIKGKKIEAFFQDFLGNITFEQLQIPFTAVATDLKTGTTISVNQGKVVPAILASIAVPMMFKPMIIADKFLIDGGVTSPVPVNIVRQMGADIVIAVNLYSETRRNNDLNEKTGIFQIGQASLELMIGNIAQEEIKQADLTVQPQIKHMHWSDLANKKSREQCINDGKTAMEKSLPELQGLITARKSIFSLKSITKNIGCLLQKFHH